MYKYTIDKEIIQMKKFKNVLILVLVASLFSLVGCSNSNGSSDTVTIGTSAEYAPMEYMDKDGNIVGVDIDVINAIAEEAGLEIEIKNYGWEALFVAVQNGEIDIATSAITITDERKETFDFTDAYYAANQLILADHGCN